MSTRVAALPEVAALPSDAALLHIGVHKTGTTALQAAMADARPELEQRGVLYPGPRQAHHRPAQAVMGRAWGWRGKGGVVRDIAMFDELVGTVLAWPGRSMVSSEHLCESNDEITARIVSAFGTERLHVVVTVRSLGRLLPSSWQQYLKFGLQRTYEEWLTDIFDDERTRKLSPSFWRRNRHDVIAKRWADALGPDRVTFVVLEHVDHSAIFRTFAQLLGIPEELLVSRMNLTSNRSMTAQESEVLRLINLRLRDELDWGQYEKLVRYGVARTIVEGRDPAPNEPKLHTPDWALDEAARRGAEQVEAIRASGIRVVGDLDALAERAPSTPAVDPDALRSVPVDVAVSGLAALVMEAAMHEVPAGLKDQTRYLVRRWTRAASAKVKRTS